MLDGVNSCISVSDVIYWQGRLDQRNITGPVTKIEIILLEVCIKAKQLFSYLRPVHLLLCSVPVTVCKSNVHVQSTLLYEFY